MPEQTKTTQLFPLTPMKKQNETQAEFHAHNDEVDLEDFCAIMERHQPENLIVKEGASDNNSGERGGGSENGDDQADGGGRMGGAGGGSGGGGGKVVVSREEVISNLVELFKEVR